MVSVVECNALITYTWAHLADYQEVIFFFLVAIVVTRWQGWGRGEDGDAQRREAWFCMGNIICGQKGRVVSKFSLAWVNILETSDVNHGGKPHVSCQCPQK